MGRLRAFISSILPRFVHSRRSTPVCSLHRVADVANNAVQTARRDSRNKQISLTEAQLAEIVDAVEAMNPEDLSIEKQRFIDEADQYNDHQSVAYVEIAQSSNYTIAAFILPPGSSIPLHDHPHMYVVSRVLWGTLHVKAFDIFPDDSARLPDQQLLAKRNEDFIIPAGDVKALTPTASNVHSFSAEEWTAVFDILLPPYDALEDRHCTYYKASPLHDSEKHPQADVILEVCCFPFLLESNRSVS